MTKKPFRITKFDRVTADIVGFAESYIVADRRKIWLKDEHIANHEIRFIDVYGAREGEVSRNAAYPEHFLEEFHLEQILQINDVNLGQEGNYTVNAWVFMRYGDNPLRKMKISIDYRVDSQLYIGTVGRRVIIDSLHKELNVDHLIEIAELSINK